MHWVRTADGYPLYRNYRLNMTQRAGNNHLSIEPYQKKHPSDLFPNKSMNETSYGQVLVWFFRSSSILATRRLSYCCLSVCHSMNKVRPHNNGTTIFSFSSTTITAARGQFSLPAPKPKPIIYSCLQKTLIHSYVCPLSLTALIPEKLPKDYETEAITTLIKIIWLSPKIVYMVIALWGLNALKSTD